MGFTEPSRSRAKLVGAYSTVSPLPQTCVRGGLLSVALSPAHTGPPLAAILPYGARTFLPPSMTARDCSTSSGARDADAHHLAGFFLRFGPEVNDPLAIGADVHLLAAAHDVRQLRRYVHATSETYPAADFDDRQPATPFEN